MESTSKRCPPSWQEQAIVSPNGWTGGQASVLRWLLGIGVAAHAAAMPAGWQGLLGFTLGLLLALGWRTLWISLLLIAYLQLERITTARGWPLSLSVGGLSVSILTIAVAWIAVWPGAPYGSVEALGRPDPRGGWRLGARFDGMWIFFALVVGLGGFNTLRSAFRNGELEPFLIGVGSLMLLTGLLGFWRRTRPIAWIVSLAHLCVVTCVDVNFAGFLPIAWLQLALFDPGWIPPRTGTLQLFYDGECALCQGFTRFAIAEDRLGQVEFGSQSGDAYARLVGEAADEFPDSIVVQTPDDESLVCSAAILRLLAALGGLWRLLGAVLLIFPRRFRDAVYNVVARARKRLGVPASVACPVAGPDLNARFLP